MSLIFLSFILLLSACKPLVPEQQKSFPHSNKSVSVQFVIDGDTIITNAGKVRLVGIDAPEKEKCGYKEASERLRTLVDKKEVTLVDDTKQPDRDNYGRLLRYVEVNGEDIGAVLVREGFVHAFPWIQSDRLQEYQRLEKETQKKKKGVLWSACEL